jgi:hypothetical protein
MPFKTFAPGVLTSSDVNTFLMQQAVITVTSTTRPTSPTTGMTIYETDTDLYRTWSGTAWRRLIANTVTYTPTTNITLGDGTLDARYTQLGDFYVVQFDLTWGSTTSFGAETAFTISAPTAIGSLKYGFGAGAVRDDSLGQTYFAEVRPISATNTIQVGRRVVSGSDVVGGSFSDTAPFTFANPDSIFGVCIYWRS